MPDQNRNWHVNIETAESRMTSVLPDASHLWFANIRFVGNGLTFITM